MTSRQLSRATGERFWWWSGPASPDTSGGPGRVPRRRRRTSCPAGWPAHFGDHAVRVDRGHGRVHDVPRAADHQSEWLDRAVNILGAPPYNYSETAVYNAIQKALPWRADHGSGRELGPRRDGRAWLSAGGNATAEYQRAPRQPADSNPPSRRLPGPVGGLSARSGAFQQAPGGGLMNNYIDVSWSASVRSHRVSPDRVQRRTGGPTTAPSSGTSYRSAVWPRRTPITGSRWARNAAGESAPRDVVVHTSGRFIGPRPPANPF
jgi:hypothetical protein